MKRRTFLSIAAGTIIAGGAVGYLSSDRKNLVRGDLGPANDTDETLNADEKEILYLASLAPSGHNTQPWFVQYLEPYHWIIGNDRTKWLPAVDPTQRETILSIGAFIQNLEYAAASFGYGCDWNLLAASSQDEQVMSVKLFKTRATVSPDIDRIKNRRTLRSEFEREVLRKEDIDELVDSEFVHYLPATAKEAQFINEQTIEANNLQADRDPAQQELANWIRFSNKEAEEYRDGLTTASLELDGISGWIVRNFYGKGSVMKKDFRERGIDRVKDQVGASAGWILITSNENSISTLLETGRRMQRLLLKVREKGIAIHPMTQILEESSTQQELNKSVGISDNVQFILRAGYIKDYPPPVSLRRPVSWFVRRK